MHIHFRRRQRGGGKFLLGLLIILGLGLLALVFLNTRIRPLMTQMAKSRVTNAAVRAINDAVNDEIASGGVSYDDLITLEKDAEGRVTALKTNMAAVNRLKADITNKVIERIAQGETADLGIPLGSVLSSGFFSGRGPVIPVRIISVSSANAELENIFTSAGINQTRHQIVMSVSVYISVLLPGYTTGTEVKSDVSIAETVLIGSVPESYAYFENVDTAEEALDNYLNLG